MMEYVVIVGVIALVCVGAFAKFDDAVRAALKTEPERAAKLDGDDGERNGPTAEEIATGMAFAKANDIIGGQHDRDVSRRLQEHGAHGAKEAPPEQIGDRSLTPESTTSENTNSGSTFLGSSTPWSATPWGFTPGNTNTASSGTPKSDSAGSNNPRNSSGAGSKSPGGSRNPGASDTRGPGDPSGPNAPGTKDPGGSRNPGASDTRGPGDPSGPNAPGSKQPSDPNASGSKHPGDPNAPGSKHPGDPNRPESKSPGDSNSPNAPGSKHPGDPNAPGSKHPGDSNRPESKSPGDPRNPNNPGAKDPGSPGNRNNPGQGDPRSPGNSKPGVDGPGSPKHGSDRPDHPADLGDQHIASNASRDKGNPGNNTSIASTSAGRTNNGERTSSSSSALSKGENLGGGLMSPAPRRANGGTQTEPNGGMGVAVGAGKRRGESGDSSADARDGRVVTNNGGRSADPNGSGNGGRSADSSGHGNGGRSADPTGSGNGGRSADSSGSGNGGRRVDSKGKGTAAGGAPMCTGGRCSEDDGESCFVAGTPVLTPSGPRAIEEIAEGDEVISRDEVTGELALRPVTRVFVRIGESLVDVEVRAPQGGFETIRATPEHPFWSLEHGWKAAGALHAGDRLSDASGGELVVVRVAPIFAEAPVYNFEVAGTHTYFAGESHAWVHNTCKYKGKEVDVDASRDSLLASGNLGPFERLIRSDPNLKIVRVNDRKIYFQKEAAEPNDATIESTSHWYRGMSAAEYWNIERNGGQLSFPKNSYGGISPNPEYSRRPEYFGNNTGDVVVEVQAPNFDQRMKEEKVNPKAEDGIMSYGLGDRGSKRPTVGKKQKKKAAAQESPLEIFNSEKSSMTVVDLKIDKPKGWEPTLKEEGQSAGSSTSKADLERSIDEAVTSKNTSKAYEIFADAAGGNPFGDATASSSKSADSFACTGASCSGTKCFVAGTPVLTPTGEVPIEQIHEGDVVLSRSESTSEVSVQRVDRVFVRVADELVDVEIFGGWPEVNETIRSTPEHPYWSREHGWIAAGALREGDHLLDASGAELSVTSVSRVHASALVYNFEVAETHTYFAGRMHAWVHNTCPSQAMLDAFAKEFKPGDLIYGLHPVREEPAKAFFNENAELDANGKKPMVTVDERVDSVLDHKPLTFDAYQTKRAPLYSYFSNATIASSIVGKGYTRDEVKTAVDFKDFLDRHEKYNVVGHEQKHAAASGFLSGMRQLSARRQEILDKERALSSFAQEFDRRSKASKEREKALHAQVDEYRRHRAQLDRQREQLDGAARRAGQPIPPHLIHQNDHLNRQNAQLVARKAELDKQITEHQAAEAQLKKAYEKGRREKDLLRQRKQEFADAERDFDARLSDVRNYELFTKTSKAGLDYQITQTHGNIHFIIEQKGTQLPGGGIKLDTDAAAKKGKTSFVDSQGNRQELKDVITHHELRWVYRHWDDPRVRERVVFWGAGGKLDPNEVFGSEAWKAYNPKHKTPLKPGIHDAEMDDDRSDVSSNKDEPMPDARGDSSDGDMDID